MFVKCLNEAEKSDVVDRYINQEQSQDDIARAYQLSVRTIRRVLQERGELPTHERFECSAADKEMLAVVRNLHGIMNPQILDNALSRPSMSHGNVLAYMVNLDDDVFESHIAAVRRTRALKKSEAANG